MGVRFRGGLAAKRKKARPRAYDEPKEACRPATVPHVRGGGRQLEKLGARECHYPHGEPGKKGFHFCGAPALDGGPYCEKHHARCYIPLPRPGEQSVKTGPWPHAEAAE